MAIHQNQVAWDPGPGEGLCVFDRIALGPSNPKILPRGSLASPLIRSFFRVLGFWGSRILHSYIVACRFHPERITSMAVR